jgi:amino acid adenylation domain-containing protein
MSARLLHHLLRDPVSRRADHTAVEDPTTGEQLSYRALDNASDLVRDRLIELGVQPKDRVGMCLRKSLDSLVSIFAILKAGAAYVPVDSTAPASRNAYIFSNCGVRSVIVDAALADGLQQELTQLNAEPQLLRVDFNEPGLPIAHAAVAGGTPTAPATRPDATLTPDDLAYILYTSGSTGKPKGVMLSHLNATSFVDWCSETFDPQPEQRFTSHAPLHFDLSILDLYVPLKHGATLVLIGESLGKDPGKLAALIAERRITNWYSTPSILTLLLQFGHLEQHDCSALQTVLFAGEVFPIKHLRALKQIWPHPRYANLYGPTETNVCTWFEVPTLVPPERDEPYPIGQACSHSICQVFDTDNQPLAPGEEGELCVRGDGVMLGYWNNPEANARVFFTDAEGHRWYHTGDVVVEQPNADYLFVGRRDRMVKKRGYRIELGEIEAALYRHPAIQEAAVVALPDEESGVRIKAFLAPQPGQKLSIIQLKQFCGQNLPAYMAPDVFSQHESLPKTSTDKIDYQRLKELD